ncbi:MAG TPA: biotin/lipoyl-containing protein, partial [Actinomycetota bacterium]|nr:biotin/lipoyl-containing protein [Actinomycetota bacterium]
MPDFKLPDLGEGVTEGEIDKWLVKEGDVVEEDDLIVEIITDKATAEIPSPWAGVVAKIHYAEGEIVPVGTVLITIGEDTTETSSSSEEPGKTPMPATVLAAGEPPPVSPGDSAAQTGNGPVKAMPPVRKLARDLGVDISAVSGSGPGGRILRPDVERMAAQGVQPAVASTTAQTPGETVPAGGQRIPLRG